MNRRDIMAALVEESSAAGQRPARNATTGYTPAAFFLHFDPSCRRGTAAVRKHVEYFRYTGMDFAKIQYELDFPKREEISSPADWRKMPVYDDGFFQEQVEVVNGIVKALKREAMVVVTLYSPFMCAGQTVGNETLDEHLRIDPDAVLPGLRAVRASLENFCRACMAVGVDGFYASTQGGEAHRPYEPRVFDELIKPVDLELWDVIDDGCELNILHVCDYWGPYTDMDRYLDYPGQIVSAGTRLTDRELTGAEIAALFDRPFLGGMDRHGVIAHGSADEVARAAGDALEAGPARHCLGASCTLPADADWDNIRTAVKTAHEHAR